MKAIKISNIAVIGAGIMGSQIAELLSRVGSYRVILLDTTEELAQRGIQEIGERLDKYFIAKNVLSKEEKADVLSRISSDSNMERGLSNADIVIEAIVERLDLKKELFYIVDRFAPKRALLTSNTSLQNISEMASATRRPEKVVGTHFFNPVAMMKLVEIVRGAQTSDETVERASEFVRGLGKEPVVCRDSSYGFLANRAYIAMVNEAAQMVWERVASPAEIDKALVLGMSLPAGPLKVWDVTGGWPILVASEQDAIREFGPEKGRLQPIIRMMSRAGYTKIYDFWEDVLSKW